MPTGPSSPIPGMDPFLESQEWTDFHTLMNSAMREFLSAQLDPKYLVRVEKRVYVEHVVEGPSQVPHHVADVAILSDHPPSELGPASSRDDVLTAVCELPMPVEHHETYLIIRERGRKGVVTVLETLSPGNKRKGTGRRIYLRKRASLLTSSAHLVEIDLLRGDRHLPTVTPIPSADYYVFVSRASRRPNAEVIGWALPSTLPTIPIPLSHGDHDARLDLQSVFEVVYERARYESSIDYSREVVPPLSAMDKAWVAERLGQWKRPVPPIPGQAVG